MKRLLILGLMAVNGWSATLGVPNIIMPATAAATPEFIRISPDSDNNDKATAKLVQQQMTNFSAQVRGSIIQSKYFQIIDVDNSVAANYLAEAESQVAASVVSSPKQAAESTVVGLKAAPTVKAKAALPDYMLIGTVSAIDAHEEINPITDTNRYSAIYSIDVAVDYKLISTQDHRMIAAFTAAGHSGDVKLITNPNQKIYHNIPKLVSQVGDDLAKEVMNQLAIQLQNGKVVKDAQDQSPKVSDVKVYSN